MTTLNKPVRRVTQTKLGYGHGCDRDRRIVVTLLPGNGDDVPDMIQLKPEGLRQAKAKTVAVVDIYTYVLKCEANKRTIEKMNLAKKKKAERDQLRRSRRIILGGRRDS